MQNKKVKTIDGEFFIASFYKVVVAIMLDIVLVLLSMLCIVGCMGFIGIVIPKWLSAVMGWSAFIYAYFAHKNIFFSLGNWVLGLKRYNYNDIIDYSGKGALFVIDNLNKTTYSMRSVFVLAYFIVLVVILESVK